MTVSTVSLRNPKLRPIIHLGVNQFENSCALLEDFQNGVFRYNINLEIDFVEAFKASAFFLDINVCTAPLPNANSAMMVSSDDPSKRDWVSYIQNYKTLSQEEISKLRTSRILQTYNDNLNFILTSNEHSALRAIVDADRVFEEQRVSLKAVRADQMRIHGLVPERMEIDTTTTSDAVFGSIPVYGNASDSDIASKRQELIYGYLRDPGNFVEKRTANILTAKFRLNGLVGTSQNKYQDIINNPVYLSLKNELQSVVQDKVVTQGEYVIVHTIDVFKTKNYQRVFSIPESIIGHSDFFLVFEVRNGSGVVVQTITMRVPHAENTKYITVPIEAPTVGVVPTYDNANVILSIRQNDIDGKFVKVYKQERFTHTVDTNAKFKFVGQMQITKDDGEKYFLDTTYRPGIRTLYRVTSLNAQETESAVFGSAVVYQSNVGPSDSPVLEKKTSCYLYTEYNRSKPNTLMVRVSDVPWNVLRFDLYRKNLSNLNEDVITVIRGFEVSRMGTQTVYGFEDSELESGNLYQYSVRFFCDDGLYRDSTTTHTITYFLAPKDVGVTTLGAPSVSTEGILDVRFEIQHQKALNEADVIQNAIINENRKDEFQELLTNNRDRLSDIFQTAMYRTDIQTGEVEFFGIIPSNQFSDRKFGVSKNVRPIEYDKSYVYTAVTYRRSGETLFYDYVKTSTDEITGKQYSYKPAFTNHPLRINESMIVTEEYLDTRPYDMFTFGDVVDIDQVMVNIPKGVPEVINLSARRILNDHVLIEWQTTGNRDMVDHYMILLVQGNTRSVVGVCRNTSQDGYFQFVDYLSNGELGALSYRIVPVYYDMTNGKEAIANSVLVQ